MIDPEMSKRLRAQAFVTALKGFYLRDLETRLRQGERVPFYLPHSSGPDDRVEIGGTFFSAAKNPIREVEDILAALMAAARPFCEGWIFELDIQSPERVGWRARDWSDKGEIRGGPEPLDQALAKMSRLGREEGHEESHEEGRKEKRPKSMLHLVGILEEKLPDWEVSLLRSCCLSLRKIREDRLFYAIDLSLAPEDAVLASTSIRTSIYSGGKIIAEGKSVATYREHILPFILEVAKRINELAVPLSEPVAAWWGQVPVVIAPPDLPPDKFLPERYRLLEI
jgi:hypothetical protein